MVRDDLRGAWNRDARRLIDRARELAGAGPDAAPEAKTNSGHLLLAVLEAPRSHSGRVLAGCGLDVARLADDTRREVVDAGDAALDDIVDGARREANYLRHRQIDGVHLLLAAAGAEGPARRALEAQGVGLVELRRQVLDRHVTFRKAELPELRSRVRPSGLFLGIAGATGLVGLVLYLGPPPEAVRPLVFVFAIGVWVLSVCMHEFGHAAAAYAGGDPSVEDAGYLTFDPRKYTHPVLSVIMPVLFLVMGGLPLPGGAVYVDRMALRSSRWDSFVSLAGPLGTLAVALVLAVPFWLGWPSGAHVVFWGAIALAASLQVMALLLNLLPLPPLDGFGVIAPLFMTWEARTRAYQASGLVLMVVFVAFWLGLPIFDPLWRLSFGALELLGIGREWVALGWRMFLG